MGGIEAMLIRTQLAGPEGKVLSADLYNQMFTMHGTTMIFLFAMPMAAAFANYLLPLQIGARDVAFPRINAFGFWCFLLGGLWGIGLIATRRGGRKSRVPYGPFMLAGALVAVLAGGRLASAYLGLTIT